MQQYPFPSASRLILEEDGVFGPIQHQSIIARLTAGLSHSIGPGKFRMNPCLKRC